MFTKIFLALFASVLAFYVHAQELDPSKILEKHLAFDGFYSHLEFLSSDELKGRDTGSEGYRKAAEYVKQEFEDLDLEPLLKNGSYFQSVPFELKSIDSKTFSMSFDLDSKKLEADLGSDISVLTGGKTENVLYKNDLVFVGYGLLVPDQEINDFENVDVRGKTIVIATGAPKNIKQRGSLFGKIRTAEEQGASGVILFSPRGLGQKMYLNRINNWLSKPRLSIADSTFNSSLIDLDFAAFASKDLVEDILALEGIKLNDQLRKMKNVEFESFDLSSAFNCKYSVGTEKLACKNVLAVMPGSDPQLKDEYVLVSAHLDHLGVGRPVKGDSIYNGMWDNASGSAAVISIASAYRNAGIQAKRSLIFACYTGEEKGLFGSKYFAEYNPLDSGQIVANVNIDMLGSLVETTDFTPLGYSHSNISESVDYAADKLGLTVHDPEEAERLYLERSDQASLIRKGTPAVYVNSGENPKNKGDKPVKLMEKWIKKTYHSPKDDLEQDYSPEAFMTGLKVNALITYHLSNIIEKVEWNTEEWIYKKYVGKED